MPAHIENTAGVLCVANQINIIITEPINSAVLYDSLFMFVYSPPQDMQLLVVQHTLCRPISGPVDLLFLARWSALVFY
jgi:hypothetical protein